MSRSKSQTGIWALSRTGLVTWARLITETVPIKLCCTNDIDGVVCSALSKALLKPKHRKCREWWQPCTILAGWLPEGSYDQLFERTFSNCFVKNEALRQLPP